MTGPISTVIVGWDRKIYKLHRNLLCDRSSHFRAALLGQFQEARTNQIEFPADDEKTFELFIYWLYGTTGERFTVSSNIQQIITLMCFARRILLLELHNDCIDRIRRIQYHRWTKGGADPTAYCKIWSNIPLLYDADPKQSQLRFCFCFQAALVASRKIQKGASHWMDADLSKLLRDGGDFASDFPRLLAFCNRRRDLRVSLNVFDPCFNGLFRTDASWKTSIPQGLTASSRALIEAIKIFDKDMISNPVNNGSK